MAAFRLHKNFTEKSSIIINHLNKCYGAITLINKTLILLL